MALLRGFKSSGSSIIGSAIVLIIASLLLLVACGESHAPSVGGDHMTANASTGCSGQDKENADRNAVDTFNYGYRIGMGLPVDAADLTRIQQDYAQLSPACQTYVQSIGERLQEMLRTNEIRGMIDRIPL